MKDTDAFGGITYVPKDWADAGKPITTCAVCGNPAPDTPRPLTGTCECSPCFIGRVLNEACSDFELRALRSEIKFELHSERLSQEAI